MARVKRSLASRRRRKKILKMAAGYRGSQSKLYRTAVERLHRAWQYAYRDRRCKKRDFRALWITRIGIAAKQNGMSYSRLMAGLKKAAVNVNRKMLAELAVSRPQAFSHLVELAKSKLGS